MAAAHKSAPYLHAAARRMASTRPMTNARLGPEDQR